MQLREINFQIERNKFNKYLFITHVKVIYKYYGDFIYCRKLS